MKAKRTSTQRRRERSAGPGETLGTELDRVFALLAPSEEACQHFRNAGLEALRGVRILLDERIHHHSTGPKKGTSIAIE